MALAKKRWKIRGTTFIKGHQLYHNFVCPHMSLTDKTPAEIAGIHLNLGSNKWENLLMKSLKYYNRGNGQNQVSVMGIVVKNREDMFTVLHTCLILYKKGLFRIQRIRCINSYIEWGTIGTIIHMVH